MNQEIMNRPMKLVMLLTATCLISFLYLFTVKNLNYLDDIDQNIENSPTYRSMKHKNLLLPQAQEAQLNQANGDSP